MAIGETGLDHYWDAAPHRVQAEAFAWHIDLAKRIGKALMIHDRNAHEAVFDVLDAEGPPDSVVFHCFSGDAAMARRCAEAGFVMSFAGPVSFRNAADLAAAARIAPADLLMVETDAPFLAPHPYRGKRNESYALPYTVRALAGLRGGGPRRALRRREPHHNARVWNRDRRARRALSRGDAGHSGSDCHVPGLGCLSVP